MAVAKLSITVEEADLRWVRTEAKRSKRSVSAVVADAIAQKRADDLLRFTDVFPGVRVFGAPSRPKQGARGGRDR